MTHLPKDLGLRRHELPKLIRERPLVAADFGLEAGVNALREIAGLKTISNSVPITLQLLFVPAK